MALTKFERFLLKKMLFGSLHDKMDGLLPEKEIDLTPVEVRRKFSALPPERKAAFHEYFKPRANNQFNLLPLRFYQKSGTKGNRPWDYAIHWEYDLPDRKTEARRLVLAGFDLRQLGGTYYTFAQLHEIRRAYARKIDITPLLDNRYSRYQMKVISAIVRDKFPLQELFSPSTPAKYLAERYYEAVEERLEEKHALDHLEKEMKKMYAAERHSLDQQIHDIQTRKKNNIIQFPTRNQGSFERE